MNNNLILMARRLVRSEKTPLLIARLVQMLRQGTNWRMRLRNPLRSIPELDANWSTFFLHQSNGVSFQERARHFVMAMEYATGTGVEGDIAEFGTMTGTTARYLAASMAALNYMAGEKSLHLFDSFEGFPEVDNATDATCPEVLSGVWAKSGCYGIGPRYLRAICHKYLSNDRIVIHEGWFSETLPKLPRHQKFALVHLDCDLYQSTIDVLRDLFGKGRLSEGAMLLFDDWHCSKGSPNFGQQKAWGEIVREYNPRYTLVGYYASSCAKMIVHQTCSQHS